MKRSWLCRIGLHKWVVVNELIIERGGYEDPSVSYKDKICIRDGCCAVILGITAYKNRVERQQRHESKARENTEKACLKWKQLNQAHK